MNPKTAESFALRQRSLPARLCRRLVSVLLGASLFGATATSAEQVRIGVTVTDLGNPFFVRLARSIENSARQAIGPDVKVYVASSAYDLDRQNSQIDFFIEKKIDLLMLIATDPVAIEPAVRRAQSKGIKVMALDVRAEGADATFTTNNVQAGELACRYIAQKLGGKGDVVIISGPSVTSITDRMDGCLGVLKTIHGIRVLSSDRNGGGSVEGSAAKMTDVLTLFPRIDAVFAINDPTALGVEEAARQAGRKEFFIVGVDGAPKVKARLHDADSRIHATVAQLPDVMAKKAIETGYALMHGKPVGDRVELIPAELLTRDDPPESTDWGQ
jgi:ribose transport system substrate-binding protein